MEEFKDIPGYEGKYQVSKSGKVRSLARKFHWNGTFRNNKERIMKQRLYKGYYHINLSINNTWKTFAIHQLVAMAFLNHKPNGHRLVVDHINTIKTDNRVKNLQIITNRKNCSKDTKGGSSKYTGVSWRKDRNKWSCRMLVDGRNLSLGTFSTEIEANEAYQNKLKTL